MITLIFCSLITLLLFLFYSIRPRPKDFPPGPFLLPIIGNLYLLTTDLFVLFSKLRKKYGDVYSVDFGQLRVVFINDFRLIKSAYNQTAFSGKVKGNLSFDPHSGDQRGIVFTEGKTWSEQRRFATRYLKDFGFGTKIMESNYQQDITELVKEFETQIGVPIDPREQFNRTSINSLWQKVTGQRYSKNDAEFDSIKDLASETLLDSKSFILPMVFPWLKRFIRGHKAALQNVSSIQTVLKRKIEEHKNTISADTNRDLIDCYLKQIEETTDQNSTFYKEIGESNMTFTLSDLFFGGIETTSVVLSWIFFTMAYYPDQQNKLHGEIKAELGLDTFPTLLDKKKIPLVEAVIMEVMRYNSFNPFIFHSTIEDVNFNGFRIPKDTAIVSNMYEVYKDDQIWGDPLNFRPERFLSEDGQSIQRHDAFISFGVGKRACPGESFSRDQLFIFVARLFQLFKVSFDDSRPKPTFDADLGIFTLYPREYKVILHHRSSE